tara:strand:+ start:94 stop:684 length:591 start_codon:yes stop_codon:yes gene_type:complete
MAKHRIALTTRDDEFVETKDARGHWAIHGKRGAWTVTHVPTGLCGHRATRLADARAWMRGAASVFVSRPEAGWTFGKVSKATLARLAACNEAGMAALNRRATRKTKTKVKPKHDPDAVPHLCAHRGLVARAIFCRCGSILDCRKSVSIDGTVLCSKCADKVAAKVGRPWPRLTARITDGRAFDADTWAIADMMYGV